MILFVTNKKRNIKHRKGKNLNIGANRKPRDYDNAPRGHPSIKINTPNSQRYSIRAASDILRVVKNHCPFCNHHKAFQGNSQGLSIKKCCRCKKELPKATRRRGRK